MGYTYRIYDKSRPWDRETVQNLKKVGDGFDPQRADYAVGLMYLSYDVGSKKAMAAVKAQEPDSPDGWVTAVLKARPLCGRCAGTGRFITGVHNGQPIGPGGPCYRCEGKGVQSWEDGKRNWYWDAYGQRV